jgi:mannose-1-phosphate guanylyltransferase/mannose-6-phosphate isomerase
VREVDAFIEKPGANTASQYVADNYLWNSGNFLFHAATMWKEIERFEPLMAEAVKETVAASTRRPRFFKVASEPFARAPKKIDRLKCSAP